MPSLPTSSPVQEDGSSGTFGEAPLHSRLIAGGEACLCRLLEALGRRRELHASEESSGRNLGPEEQRMVWLAAARFGDDGAHARKQLRRSLGQAWRLGFEAGDGVTFASCYEDWCKSAG